MLAVNLMSNAFELLSNIIGVVKETAADEVLHLKNTNIVIMI
jgi:hypothetical protein